MKPAVLLPLLCNSLTRPLPDLIPGTAGPIFLTDVII